MGVSCFRICWEDSNKKEGNAIKDPPKEKDGKRLKISKIPVVETKTSDIICYIHPCSKKACRSQCQMTTWQLGTCIIYLLLQLLQRIGI